jgi:hypothetical protein
MAKISCRREKLLQNKSCKLSVRYRDADITFPAKYLSDFSELILQTLQILPVEMTCNNLSRRYKFLVHQIIDGRELRELFYCPWYI